MARAVHKTDSFAPLRQRGMSLAQVRKAVDP